MHIEMVPAAEPDFTKRDMILGQHLLVTSRVNSNIKSTLKLKVTHFFVCALYKVKSMLFAQLPEMSAQ